MPELIIKHGDRPPERLVLERLRTTIGRSTRSDVCIPDPFASRVHAEIRREGDHYILQDLGSANGTRFNGQPLSGEIPIDSGDRFQIGETVFEFVEPRAVNQTLVGDGSDFNPSVTISLSANKSATELFQSIEKARQAELATKKVKAQTDLLGLISKVGVTLLAATTLDETLQQVADLVFEAVPAERCVIMLREDEAEQREDCEKGMKIAVARLREKSDDFGDIRVSRSVLREVVENHKSVLTSDAQHDPRFASQTMVLQGIRSVLAVPLSGKDQVFGLIYADSPVSETTFTEDHLKVLTTLASVAAIRVENARLLEERLERERMERELALATEIQQKFQPSAPPIIPGFELQGISFSCYEIGGDYYDFIQRENEKMLVALGDVSGKGTAAALLMSSLHAAIHAQIAARTPLLETVDAVNKYLAENTPPNRFVTLFVAELDTRSGTLAFVNAGHNPPLVARADGSVEQLASGGFPLGILPNATYEVGQTHLNSGEALVIYSDGVNETVNRQDEEFGVERLAAVVKDNLHRTASGLRDRIESALSAFADGADAPDDITLVIVKRQ
ncbi:MAG: SpoIIE family protein phosphatase [Acidobacteriota bacterium]|nr:SpoIIE family protein phosphatase [Acidobacteriota bacterium]